MEELMAKYLANELSEEKRRDFEEQLVNDESLKVEFEDHLNLWTESTQLPELSFDKSKAWNTVKEQIKPEDSVVQFERKPRHIFLKIAASLLILLTAGYFLSETATESINNFIGVSTLTEVKTDAEMKEVNLPDGSVVKLNANSKLAYEKGFGEAHRNIILKGGANFDVERNESLSFVIEANNGKVEVLGTSFDVKAYPGRDVELNVAEGTVKFSSAEEEIKAEVLNAGEKAKLSTDGKSIEIDLLENQNYAAWWTRELVFQDTPFDKVIKSLEETYWVEIDYSDALLNCPLTATYENKPLDEVFELLKLSFPDSQLKVIRTKENKIKLEGKACAN